MNLTVQYSRHHDIFPPNVKIAGRKVLANYDDDDAFDCDGDGDDNLRRRGRDVQLTFTG